MNLQVTSFNTFALSLLPFGARVGVRIRSPFKRATSRVKKGPLYRVSLILPGKPHTLAAMEQLVIFGLGIY